MSVSFSLLVRQFYCLIYLTLYRPVLINFRQCSLLQSINSCMYSMYKDVIGLFSVLTTVLKYGKVPQWLKFRTVNHETMDSNLA